jgi:hypothetical protein
MIAALPTRNIDNFVDNQQLSTEPNRTILNALSAFEPVVPRQPNFRLELNRKMLETDEALNENEEEVQTEVETL